uniref:HNH/ENDO VII family nuclease n=1 Tax=Xenorhabdus sp. PB61.4 TaxID=2788940 RepID=UPI00272A6548
SRWNSQNQLIGLQTPGGQQWDYRYDAFGRRTEKVCEQAGQRTTYLWDGDVPAEIREYRHNRLYSIRHLVFDGWQLLAQQIQFFTPDPENRSELMAGEVQTQYAVCAPTSEPLALFDPQGHRVWRRPPQSLYGLRLSVLGENAELNPGLQYAGQCLDEESGLVYNRFRYYSPVAGQYLTPDPIGLAGGENPYAYVGNPTIWIDPLGLAGCWTAKNVVGRKVYQRNDLFDPHHIDEYGRTNIQRMKKGQAPIGKDGLEVNLHHVTQDEPGPMAEILSSTHSKHDRKLHMFSNQWDKTWVGPDGIRRRYNSAPPSMNRRPFNRWKKKYWKARALDFLIP